MRLSMILVKKTAKVSPFSYHVMHSMIVLKPNCLSAWLLEVSYVRLLQQAMCLLLIRVSDAI